MWIPTAQDSRIMQGAGLLVLLLALGGRWVPPLRRHYRLLAGGAGVLYVALGLGLVLYHLAF